MWTSSRNGPHPSYKAWMKLHDETATAIAGAFPSIDLETEASLSLVSGVKVKERLDVRLKYDAMVTIT